MQAGLLSGWRQGSLAKSSTNLPGYYAVMGQGVQGVCRRKDAEFCKVCQKRNERRNGKQDSAAS